MNPALPDKTKPGFPDCRLKVVALALDIATGDVAENLRRAGEMLARLKEPVDVAVLPELFTTSFMRDTDAMLAAAESRRGRTVEWALQQAADRDMMLSGSFVMKEPDKAGGHHYFNCGFMVLPSGEIHFYNKHHLFCLSKEAEVFTHGHKRPPVVNFRGWNITINICYELRFPVWMRNVGFTADLILLPANWPDARGYAWQTLIRARAIENHVAIVGADRSGTDDFGTYTSLAVIVDSLGRPIAPAPAELLRGCPAPKDVGYEIQTPYGPVLVAEFNLADLQKLRTWLPTDRDADSFCFV